MFHKAGCDPTKTMQCRVMSVNYVNWTVDVLSTFDRKFFFDIQVGAPYLHFNNGEGIYVVPEVGALCQVCIPGDSSAPFVQSFVAPMEVAGDPSQPDGPEVIEVDQAGNEQVNKDAMSGSDAPDGTTSRSGSAPYPRTDANFSAGRPLGKPGDIYLRTRDGNFIVLHRGGVLQIGATELAQRIFVPINNRIMDVSGEYEHLNTGGTVQWGIQEGPSVSNPACQHMETYRLYANDKYTDIRIAKSKVYYPLGEPDGEAGSAEDLNALNIGTDEVVMYEICVSPAGFKPVTGDPVDGNKTRNGCTLRFFFDKKGGTFLRCEGNALFRFKKKLKIVVDEDIEVKCKNFSLQTGENCTVGGGPMTEVQGDFVRLGAGTQPVARMGDAVSIALPVANLSGTLNGSPFTGVLTMATPVFGAIVGGNPNVNA